MQPIIFLLQNNVSNVKNMQWYKFIVDHLHEELVFGKLDKACLLMLQVCFFCDFTFYHVMLSLFTYIPANVLIVLYSFVVFVSFSMWIPLI